MHLKLYAKKNISPAMMKVYYPPNSTNHDEAVSHFKEKGAAPTAMNMHYEQNRERGVLGCGVPSHAELDRGRGAS